MLKIFRSALVYRPSPVATCTEKDRFNVQLTATGAWPSGQTQTPHLHELLLWGYKPVNTPLQVLHGIMHSSITTYSTRAKPEGCMWLRMSALLSALLIECIIVVMLTTVWLGV